MTHFKNAKLRSPDTPGTYLVVGTKRDARYTYTCHWDGRNWTGFKRRRVVLWQELPADSFTTGTSMNVHPALKLSACTVFALAFAGTAGVFALFTLSVATFNAWAATVPALGVAGCIYTAYRLMQTGRRAWSEIIVRVVESGCSLDSLYYALTWKYGLLAALFYATAIVYENAWLAAACLLCLTATGTCYAKARAV